MNVEQQLLDHGKVNRGRLGVLIQQVDQQLAETFGLKKPVGALVSSVEKNSPAEKAGIKPGDVILNFNGKEISRSAELPPLVSELSPGTAATIELWRKGKSKTITMKVGEMKVAASANDGERKVAKLEMGLSVRPLTPEELSETNVQGGLLVENVIDGPAARAGIRTGDVILSVNGEETGSIETLRTLVEKSGKRLALLIMRGEDQMFVPINLG